MKFARLTLLLVLALALVLPSTAGACAVCYGDPSSSESQGLTWAITALLGVVGVVLGGVVAFFVYVGKKEAQFQAEIDTATAKELLT